MVSTAVMPQPSPEIPSSSIGGKSIKPEVLHALFSQKRPWFLASSSPRRAGIFSTYQFEFKVVPPQFDESETDWTDPEEVAIRFAEGKAMSAARLQNTDGVFIGSDTIVELDGKVLGKPNSFEENFQFIMRLQGARHRVISSFFAYDSLDKEAIFGCQQTSIKFRTISEEQARAYVSSGEGKDKAGGYAIQGVGGFMIERIEGSYNRVVGFPIEEFIHAMLKKSWLFLPSGLS